MKKLHVKNIIPILLALSLLFSSFAACKNQTSTSLGSDPTLSSQPEVTTTKPDEVSENTTHSQTDEENPPVVTPEPVVVENIESVPLAENNELVELRFNNEKYYTGDTVIQSGNIYNNQLLLINCTYVMNEEETDDFGDPIWDTYWSIDLFDLEKGAYRGRCDLGKKQLSDAGFLEDGTIYFTAFDDNTGYDNLEIYVFISFPEQTSKLLSMDSSCFCGISNDGRVWTLDFEARLLRGLTPFDNRPDLQFDADEDWSSATYTGTGNGCAYFLIYDDAWNSSFIGINLSDGTLTDYPHLRNVNWEFENILPLYSNDSWMIVLPNNPYTVNTFPKNNDFGFISAAAGTFFAEYQYLDEVGVFSVYDAKNGSMLGSIAETEGIFGTTILCMDESGRLFFTCYGNEEGNGVPRIVVWQYDTKEPQPSNSFRKIDVRGSSSEARRLENEIYMTYGIHVFFDEISLSDLVWDYTCEYIDDELQIVNALKDLKEALAKYPQGFFEELCTSSFRGVEIYLCGSFTPTGETGISSAAALTSTKNGAIIMAFNINYMYMVAQNLSHELMHAMEHRIEEYCEENGIAYQDEWNALNPSKFKYYDSYHDKNGNEISDTTYTLWEGSRKAWFVDPYSKSYATEDRARVFENLFVANGNAFESSHLMAKAEYLCGLIRTVFKSVQNAESVSWERLLENRVQKAA